MDGWNISFLLGWPIFRDYVSFREGISYLKMWGCRHVSSPKSKTLPEPKKRPHTFFVGLKLWLKKCGDLFGTKSLWKKTCIIQKNIKIILSELRVISPVPFQEDKKASISPT